METGRVFSEERRLVSVLFADIVGFTSFADLADVEVIGDLIRDIWQVLDRVIERHGGRIDKHTGDGVMAIWGAPIAKDDDAEKAVIAGLDLLKAFDQFSANSNMTEVQKLKLRVGINSGLVLSTYVGTHGEYTVIGDTVNVANRIENEAEPGTIWIGESTYNLVKGAFEVKNIGPLKLRGKMDQTNIYQVLGINIHKRRERFISYGGLKSNLVGRERELEEIDRSYAEVRRNQIPKLVLVVGEAGIGKSRLMMEFTKRKEMAGEKLFLLSGRALSQTNKVPFYLWKSIFYNLFDIKEDDEPGQAKEKLSNRLREILAEESALSDFNKVVDSFAILLGLPKDTGVDTEEYDLDAAFSRIISLIRGWANRNLVIMIIDDLQWADSASLELVSKILQGRFAAFLFIPLIERN
jgi:class 3 adenylate cyclase